MSTLDTIEEKTTGILNLKPTTHQKLANHWNIELRKESKKFILDTAVSISNEKNIKVEPINSALRNEIIVYCDEVPFGIIPPNRYLDIEKMNTSSSSDGDDYYASYYDNIDDADYGYIDGGN